MLGLIEKKALSNFFDASLRIITPKNSVLQKRIVRILLANDHLGLALCRKRGEKLGNQSKHCVRQMHKNDNNCDKRNRLMGISIGIFSANSTSSAISEKRQEP